MRLLIDSTNKEASLQQNTFLVIPSLNLNQSKLYDYNHIMCSSDLYYIFIIFDYENLKSVENLKCDTVLLTEFKTLFISPLTQCSFCACRENFGVYRAINMSKEYLLLLLTF